MCKVLEQRVILSQQKLQVKIKNLMVMLKYYEGKPVIENIKRISKPGLRIFKSSKQVPTEEWSWYVLSQHLMVL